MERPTSNVPVYLQRQCHLLVQSTKATDSSENIFYSSHMLEMSAKSTLLETSKVSKSLVSKVKIISLRICSYR